MKKMKNIFKYNSKFQGLKILSITFISLMTCICISLFAPAITHSSSLKSDCLDNQNCLIISQADRDRINKTNETSIKPITPASRQIELIEQARSFYGVNSLSSIATILFMTIGPLKIVPAFVKLTY